MNCYKTIVFRYLSVCTAFALLFVYLSTETFAQNRTLFLDFNNYVAASKSTSDNILKRPRIVGAEIVKTEIINLAIESKEEVSNSMMAASQIERQAFDILNLRRAERRLPQLVWSEDMARVARSHSQEMARFKFFSHAGRNGSMVDKRADILGFKKWKAIGENIAYNRGYEKPAEFACERWMQSVSHRENILNPRWQEAGIGVAITADGTYYFTEVFVVH